MSEHRWVLTDVEKNIWKETFGIGKEDLDVGIGAPWYVRKRRLHGGLREGVDVVEVHNGTMGFVVVPTRGMGIWRAECGDLPVGWQSPVRGPVHPHYVNPHDRGGLGWLNGFDELVVRCGLDWTGAPGKDGDIPHTLHGRIANLPASKVEVQIIPGDPAEIIIIGEVDESALFLPKLRLVTKISTKIDAKSFTIEDTIINLQSSEAEYELLYHCNFGPPFLEEGSLLHLPASLVAPRDAHAAEETSTCNLYGGPTAGYAERCYWYMPIGDDQGNSLAMLHNAAADKGVAVRFNTTQLPCFTQWKNIGAEADGYVTGLEPGSDFPNPKPFEREQGRLKTIPAGGSASASVTIEVLDCVADVSRTTAEVAALQGRAPRQVRDRQTLTLTPPGV